MKRLLPRVAGWLVGFGILLLRTTCRLRIHNDPRTALASKGVKHVFGTFHAHQIGGFLAAERGTGAIVSRSVDGEIIVPALLLNGHVPIRGSSGTGRKGGATALQALIKHVRSGQGAMLAVDGPRGPRGSVQRGIGMLSQKTGAAVLMAVVIPSRRLILRRTWDQIQVPLPLSTINIYVSRPLLPQHDESLDHFTQRIESALKRLEEEHDAEEVSKRSKASDSRPQSRAAA